MVLSLLVLLIFYFSPFTFTSLASDDDAIDDEIEDLNHRYLDIDFDGNLTQIESRLESDTSDRIRLDILADETGLTLTVEYSSGEEENEISFAIQFNNIIEYVDLDSDGVYNTSNDAFIQQIPINDFQSINYSTQATINNNFLHIFNLTTTDGVFSVQLYAVEEFQRIENNLVTPTEFKFDIGIQDFGYLNASSDLALNISLLSDTKYEEEDETEDETEGYASDEMGVRTSINEFSGFFSWGLKALVNGTEMPINSSALSGVPGTEQIFISYPRGAKILHDPKIGVEGILRFPSSLLPLIIIAAVIIGVVAAVSVVISKQEYREYLLTRVLHINPEPHRLKMEEVLENENRSNIISYILQDPGIHFNEILRKTGISAGTLAWHLDILETYKIIRKRRIGQYLVYFSYLDENPFAGLDPKIIKSRTTLDILQLISDNQGMYQNQIAKRLDLDHKTVKYHLEKLIEINLIYTKKKGLRQYFYPVMREIEEVED